MRALACCKFLLGLVHERTFVKRVQLLHGWRQGLKSNRLKQSALGHGAYFDFSLGAERVIGLGRVRALLVLNFLVERKDHLGQKQIHHEEGTENNKTKEKAGGQVLVVCTHILVHQRVDPVLEGQALEDRKHRVRNVVEVREVPQDPLVVVDPINVQLAASLHTVGHRLTTLVDRSLVGLKDLRGAEDPNQFFAVVIGPAEPRKRAFDRPVKRNQVPEVVSCDGWLCCCPTEAVLSSLEGIESEN